MDPKIWGPPTWFFLHTTALNYPYQPSPLQKHYFKQFLINLGGVLPCQVCQDHYNKNLLKYSIDEAVQSKDKAFKWMVDIHNAVNKQLGKPIMKLSKAYEKYRNHYGLEADHHYTDDKGIKWYLWLILIIVVTVGLTKYFWVDIRQMYKSSVKH